MYFVVDIILNIYLSSLKLRPIAGKCHTYTSKYVLQYLDKKYTAYLTNYLSILMPNTRYIMAIPVMEFQT